METKFTKGEWSVGSSFEKNSTFCVDVSRSDGSKIEVCNIRGLYSEDVSNTKIDEDLANAHLISVAPEMYAMLQSFLDDGDLQSFAHEEIEQLLARARGEQA